MGVRVISLAENVGQLQEPRQRFKYHRSHYKRDER